MDHLQLLSPRRLGRMLAAFALSLALSLVTLPLLAAGEVYSNSTSGQTFGSVAEACQYGGVNYGYCGAEYVGFTNGLHRWNCKTKPWPSDPTCLATRQAMLSSGCASPNVLDTATGICNPPACADGQVRNTITNQCQPPCPAAGAAGGSDYTSPYTVHPPTICRAGCSLTVGGGFQIPSSTGTWYGVNGLVHTGDFCDGSPQGGGSGNEPSYDEPGDPPPVTVTPEDDPPRCKAGECPGEVNGVYVCVPCGAAASETKPVKTFDRKTETTTTGTPPNETTQTKTTDTVAKHDGSGTVTSTTSTTTTTTGPNGTTTDKTTQEKKEPQESFCKDNPTSAFCKEGKWGGACGAFTCEGDAVQCALAREVHQRNCESTAPNALTDLADSAAAGTDTGANYIQSEKSAAAISAQSKFNESLQASPIAGACPSPRSIAVPGGYSFEISFEKPCEFAGYLGFFIQAFAYLSAALIVLRNPTA